MAFTPKRSLTEINIADCLHIADFELLCRFWDIEAGRENRAAVA